MKSILDFPLTTFRLGLWRLGHAGLVIRYRNGPVIAVDPYLSDAAATVTPRLARRFPPPIPPSQFDADVVVITTAQREHLDPETLGPAPARGHASFLGSAGVAPQLIFAGAPAQRTIRMVPGRAWVDRGLVIEPRATYHGSASAEELGVIMDGPGPGPRVYVTGDTLDDPGLDRAGPVDVLVVPINGKFGNMNVEGAARLAGALPARWVVPCHYDLTAADGESPEAFLYAMEQEGRVDRARVLPVMHPLMIGATGDAVTVTSPLELEWSATQPVRVVALPHGYHLRHFRETDLVDLGFLYHRVFGGGHTEDWFRRQIVEDTRFEPERVIVVECGGRVVASAVAWEDDTHHARGRGVLQFAATHPDHHQRGLGKAVCAGVQRYFKDRHRRGVLVRTEDWRLRSIRAFMALGFTPVDGTPETKARWDNVRAAVEAGVLV